MYIIRIDDDDYDDYSVFNMRTISVDNGLENFFSGNIGIGEDQNINLNILVNLANPVSFLKQNVLRDLKL